MPNNSNKDYLNLVFHEIVFYVIHSLFPTSSDVKPYVNNDNKEFLPILYYTYNHCKFIDNVLICDYKLDKKLKDSRLPQLMLMENFPIVSNMDDLKKYLIKYYSVNKIKKNRKENGLPEKYWNF